MAEREIERDSSCFCCGVDNEAGLHLVFAYPAEGEAQASLEVPAQFSGWKRMTHGGFLAMLLDEAMAHACLYAGLAAVTGEIPVRYLKPVETGARIAIFGKVEERRGRILRTRGWILDGAGGKVAEGKATFLGTVGRG